LLTDSNITMAKETMEEIATLLVDEINLSGLEAISFAYLYVADKYPKPSIPLCVAASLLFVKEGGKSLTMMANINKCAKVLEEAACCLIEESITVKPVLNELVIPLLRDMQTATEEVKMRVEKTKCDQVVQILFSIANLQKSVEGFKAAEETYEKCLSRIKQTHASKAASRAAYAYTLEGLGDLYLQMSKTDRANDCYDKAIAAYQCAEDIRGGKKRKSLIEACETKRTKRRATEM